MERRVLIFAGPSLPLHLRPTHPGVEWAAPPRRGELLEAARQGWDAIGLVDGRLIDARAVTPAEVREAARHARLFGASSLGALRAVECPGHMVGIGEVFEAFRSGVLWDDDELVALYDPQTFELHTWPLVSARGALGRLVGEGTIPRAVGLAALTELRRVPWAERSSRRLEACVTPVAGQRVASELRRALEDRGSDPKVLDGLALVRAVVAEGVTAP